MVFIYLFFFIHVPFYVLLHKRVNHNLSIKTLGGPFTETPITLYKGEILSSLWYAINIWHKGLEEKHNAVTSTSTEISGSKNSKSLQNSVFQNSSYLSRNCIY